MAHNIKYASQLEDKGRKTVGSELFKNHQRAKLWTQMVNEAQENQIDKSQLMSLHE